MAVLNGINIKGTEEVHQLDYEKAIAHKPKLVKSYNDLDDKPFYSEQGEVDILPKADYTFALMDETMGLYGNQQSFKLIGNEEYIVEYDGNTYNCLATDLSDETYSLIIIGNLSIMDSSLENTGEPFIIQSNYTNEAIEGGIATKETDTVHNIRIYQSREVIKHLDSKFIKDMYYTEGGKYILFKEQNVPFVAMSENGLQGYGYIQNPPIDINGSLDCIVEWDGVGYRCTPMVDSDTEESREIYVGNLGFLGGNDTGEPFLILDNLQMTVFATIAEGTHKVCVYQSDEVVHQLDPKYVDAFTKEQTLMLLGFYVDEVNTLLGGED